MLSLGFQFQHSVFLIGWILKSDLKGRDSSRKSPCPLTENFPYFISSFLWFPSSYSWWSIMTTWGNPIVESWPWGWLRLSVNWVRGLNLLSMIVQLIKFKFNKDINRRVKYSQGNFNVHIKCSKFFLWESDIVRAPTLTSSSTRPNFGFEIPFSQEPMM